MNRTSPAPSLDEAAQKMHRLTNELLQRYQFRDVNQICCHGISVAQWHILELLSDAGPLTMQEIAGRLYKSVSTMTRVVAQVVRRGLARREVHPEDARAVQISLTPKGRQLVESVDRDLVETQKAILASIPPEQWEAVFKVLEALAQGVRGWQSGCCGT